MPVLPHPAVANLLTMLTLLTFLLGLALLIGGAELLVRGASKLAVSWGISPLVVGLTIVAFGTSSPELAVSVQSAYAGKVDIALGNVVGSNIFNVLFILGVSALITPLVVSRQIIRQEVPIMIGASVLMFGLAYDTRISFIDGVVMFGLLVVYTIFLVVQSRRESGGTANGSDHEVEGESTWDRPTWVRIALVIAGLVLLVAGSNFLVDAAIIFAKSLGISELVIGLTIVAAGTSMPEVATSIMAAFRGQRDIAVGNVVGSSTFNILGVLGLASIVSPSGLPVAPAMIAFDIPIMVVVALACLPIFFTGRTIARWEGFVFLAYYAAYTCYLILYSQQHDLLNTFNFAMMTTVLPLTLVTIAALSVKALRDERRY
jgi:cation:H+ antiporter